MRDGRGGGRVLRLRFRRRPPRLFVYTIHSLYAFKVDTIADVRHRFQKYQIANEVRIL